MYPLPDNSQLGRLRMIEVYDFYDGPRLFLCKNSVGTLYLGLWYDQREDSESWLYVPVSPERLAGIRSGKIDLRDAFGTPEDAVAFLVTTDASQGPCTTESLLGREIPVEHLPPIGDTLPKNIPLEGELQREMRFERVSPDLVAKQTGREVVNFSISPPNAEAGETPIDILGSSLTHLQGVLEAITLRKLAQRNVNTRRRPLAREESRLVATYAFAGSFGLRLESARKGDLLGQTLIGESIEELAGLLKASHETEALKSALQELHPRAAARYRDFIKFFVDRKTPFRLEWASPLEGRGYSGQFDVKTLSGVSSFVERVLVTITDEYEIEAVLVGANLRHQTFELRDADSGIKYAGTVAPQSMATIEFATLNQTYLATIKESAQRHVASGRRTTSYELLKLKEGGEEVPGEEEQT